VGDIPVLRDFEPPDQVLVRRLVVAGLVEHWGAVDESLNRDLVDIASSYAHGRTVVADVAGDIVGTGTIVPHGDSSAELVRMSIAAGYRRSGLGRRIVDELCRTAREWSVARVVLETSSHWTDVIAFYLACGFEITGERKGDFGRDTWFERRP
jgi:putative acetyltransferase